MQVHGLQCTIPYHTPYMHPFPICPFTSNARKVQSYLQLLVCLGPCVSLRSPVLVMSHGVERHLDLCEGRKLVN